MGLALHPVFTVLIAIAPAVFAYWRGRGLLRDLDDPALPERLLALQRLTAPVFGASIALLLVTSPRRFVWALPLLILARLVGAYPLRKTLHSETWSVWRYLSFYLRLIVAAFGFWLLIAALPAFAASGGSRDWIVGGLLGAVAVAWNARNATVFRAVLRTTPVEVPAIGSRFAKLTKEFGLPHVRLDHVHLHGGVFANAVALPSIRTPAVVVTDTLMARLDEDEVTAILAHELAHIEHYNPRRLTQANIAACVIVSAAVLLSPAIRLAAPGLSGFAFLVWPGVILSGLALQLKQRQKHETESDLRAVAVTGDPEALVRALTKLHVFARVPRRWEADFERHATHPSLARRIQAIRRASGVEPQSITEPATFVGAASAASVTFHSNRVEWHEGSSMTHAIYYQSLREVRIDVRSSRAPQLIAVDTAARRWTIPLQTGDVARAQSILDVIDVHLGKPDEPARKPIPAITLLTLVVIAMGMAVGQMSVLFTGLLGMVQPASQVTAAVGISALAAAGLVWRDPVWWQLGELSAWLPVTLGVSGAVLTAMAYAARPETRREMSDKMLGALALSAFVCWVFVGLSGVSSIDLHRNVREWPSATILTLACAGALGFSRSRRLRWAAVSVALVGLLAGYVGSTNFVDRFVADPFVAQAEGIEVKAPAIAPVSEFAVDFLPSQLTLSPASHYAAFTTEDAHEQSTIHAGKTGGSLASFAADEAMFLSESRLLLLERQPRDSILRLVELSENNREMWALTLPVQWADLSIDRPSQKWRLLGRNADNDIVSAEGQIGTMGIRQSVWKRPNDAHNLQLLAVSGGNVVALDTRYGYSATQAMQLLPTLPFLWSMRRPESSLWRLTDRGAEAFATSNAELTCHSGSAIDKPSTCTAFDGTRTRFFAVDAKTQRLTAQASLTGRMYASNMGDDDWLSGWWDQAPVAVHPATRTSIQFTGQTGERPYQIAVGRSVVAGIFPKGRTSTIRIHSMTR